MVLLAFAFLAGIVTILSPCILPVLPLILSGSTGGGKARPWGIITGFIVSFTAFTLTLSALVQALGISPDLMRWIAAGIVLAFGIVMVVPALKEHFMALATRLTSRGVSSGPSKKAGGFWGGIVLGFSLGLVWTPCVGPIMASVISLSLTRSVDAGSLFITLAYSLGTSIPLLAILLGGRSLLNRFPALVKNTGGIQKVFGVLMIATALALFTGADRSFQTWILTTFPRYGSGLTSIENRPVVQEELAKLRPAVQDEGAVGLSSGPDPLTLRSGEWLNSPPLTLEGLRGRVVLVDFWTYSCINCLRTLPYLRAWNEKYRDKGLVIVGVHSPEFAFEQDVGNLRRAMAELKVTWPVVQDNAFGIWTAFQNQYWPAHYLYDRGGSLVETHFGEGNYAETEAAIRKALGLDAGEASEVQAPLPAADRPRTPETYLGYGRGSRFASPEDVAMDRPQSYSLPAELPVNKWALGGVWTIGKEASTSQEGSSLLLHFQAAKVYLVIKPLPGGAKTLKVSLDGRPVSGGDVKKGLLKVDADRLYQLIDLPRAGEGLLSIETGGAVMVYALTFG